MKTALRTIAVAGLLVLLVVLSLAQQPQMTAITTIAGDAVTATRARGAMEYLPTGVIWMASSDYPYTGKNFVYRSTDNGATWVKINVYTNPGLSSVGITGLAARDANLCMVCTSTGEILRTTNAGAKWDTVGGYTGDLAFCDGVRFVVGDTMIAYGDADDKGVFVARSFDAGKTWSRIPNVNSSLPGDSLNTGGIYESQASAAQGSEVFGRTIWLTLDNTLGDPGSILKSTDAGATWSWFRIALPGGASVNNYLRSITFKDANVGYGVCRQAYGTASVNGYYLLKTTDGGRTWSDTISVEPGKGHSEAKPFMARAIRGTNTVVAVGWGTVGAKSWISNDNGTTWAPITTPTSSTSADLRNIAFGSTTQGIAIGYYNMVKVAIPGTTPVTPQLYLSDDFTASAGTVLTSAGWIQSATSAVNPLAIASPSLTFTGHPGSGVGGAAPMANNGQDVYRTFPPVSSGDVYLSFLMNISAVQSGDYFIAVSPSASQVNYYARLHVQSSGAGYGIGIKKSNETGAQYGTSVYNLNTTYLVVLKYTFAGTATDTTNDPISIYVVPNGSSIATEPATPEINGYVSTGKNDAADLASVTLRQGSATNAPTMVIDAIRVGNSWAAAISPAVADYINVTFTANAAAWRDTLSGASGLVQLRGTTMTAAGQSVDDGTTDTLSTGTVIDWNAKTTMYLTNIGGDYWQGTFKIKPGTKIAYKFFANAQNKVVKPNDSFEHNGWENNVVDIPGFYSTNRGLDLTGVTKDTVLPLQFINGIGHGLMKQYDKPYAVKDSTYALYVRVDMAGWEDFNPANHKIAVRGSNKSDWGQTGELSWGPSYQLSREGVTMFYSNVIHVPNKYANAGVQFKFLAHYAANPLSEDWSAMAYNPGTQYDLTTRGVDSTIQWKWFDNLKPTATSQKDTVIVTYLVNMNKAISQRGFAHGDTIQVRAGYGGTAAKVYTKPLTRVGLTTLYSAIDTLTTTLNKSLVYQYYLIKYGQDLREIYFDFDFPDPSSSDAERRRITPNSKTFSILDTVGTTASPRRVPQLRNTKLLSKAVAVKYTVNIRPAIYQVAKGDTLKDIQGTIHVIKKDSVMKWGVFINGPATGGWGPWGGALRSDTTRKMFDDGTHGDDVAGDSIYTRTYAYKTTDILGQEFKFGIGGGDNEAGFGNNHYYIIDDTGPTVTAPSQYGSIYPKFYTTWDFDLGRPRTVVGIEEVVVVPLVANLSQNYPNPFNPSTTIRFTLTSEEIVTLKIFNTLGQEVMTLLHEKRGAGNHIVKFDAAKLTSGVYFYQINAGKLVETKKMTLLK
ncbi:MAG: T9SS type A sorting domain-containing protein [Ignavibacteriales bacterium]|nr:T9SS type A sorting domain-containing protein [Ignavibacteriales bacterium]